MNFLSNTSYSKDVKYWALMALGSIISSAEKRIIPYQELLLKTLYDIITGASSGAHEL